MDRIGEAPEIGDRDGLDLERADSIDRRVDRGVGERDDDLSVAIDPLVDLDDPFLRHDGLGATREAIVEELLERGPQHAATAAHDPDGIAVPLRRDQGDARPLAGHERIDADRRAVGERARAAEEARRIEAEGLGGGGDRAEEAGREVGRRRRHLADDERAVRAHDHRIREGPPDVDADPEAGIAHRVRAPGP